jgi:hypothetical protein
MIEENEWIFKDGAKPQGSSDGFWYDLTLGGYLKPERVLSDPKQLAVVNDAIATLRSFELALEDAELLNEF